jgi:hypothetical protein
MTRVSFYQVFLENGCALGLLRPVSINGLFYSPLSNPLSDKRVQWGGVDFTKLRGRDLAIEATDSFWEIKGFY